MVVQQSCQVNDDTITKHGVVDPWALELLQYILMFTKHCQLFDLYRLFGFLLFQRIWRYEDPLSESVTSISYRCVLDEYDVWHVSGTYRYSVLI